MAQKNETVDHSIWNQLLQKHVDSEGWVNYQGFQEDTVLLADYLHQLSTSVPEETAKRNDRIAYFINLYNAFTIALILREYPIRSIKEIRNPWTQKFIPLGDRMYSLNDIEHGILRNLGEPRIHFAINCASISCPKLLNEAFVAQNLEAQLTQVTKAFINGPENQLHGNPIKLSKIFKWYRSDFEVNGKRDLLGFIRRYSHQPIAPHVGVDYLEYHWDLNGKK